ncbi:uroporphyrinogen-III synthase [Microbacterium amylolyticum]|uniref:Uroporphyrinogen-III synthase n=1 Tax=Microbacterium amylolyticum TaxID=936337 RepID=A0ABS4ZER1_9MICO|nr:uroporphyrinogen-III synthase [Microbacterium amylolyticum]MBP2435777.1 uroporphyrinogen-III synthase [Microbacterium amylolyticum]
MTAENTRPKLSSALDGCTIVIAVDRRAGELAAALERHGATVRQAPALTIIPHIDDDALLGATRALIASPPDVVVATTGVGFRGWIEAAHEADLADQLQAALENAQIVARGPKARGAVQQAGFTVDWVAESETARELGEFLLAESVNGKRVAVQHHGSGADGLDELFTSHGADVVSLTVYRWGPPPNPDVVRHSVIQAAAGDVDAVMFTSAPGTSEWLAEAERAGVIGDIRRRAEKGRLVMAAVGPITVTPLDNADIPAIVAERGRLGSLVRSVVTHFGGGSAPGLDTVRGRIEMRSSGVVLAGTYIPLSPTSTAIIGALFDAGGAVIPRRDLHGVLPRSSRNTHAVEMAIARLRESMGFPDIVKTVVKRGYRLNVEDL